MKKTLAMFLLLVVLPMAAVGGWWWATRAPSQPAPVAPAARVTPSAPAADPKGAFLYIYEEGGTSVAVEELEQVPVAKRASVVRMPVETPVPEWGAFDPDKPKSAPEPPRPVVNLPPAPGDAPVFAVDFAGDLFESIDDQPAKERAKVYCSGDRIRVAMSVSGKRESFIGQLRGEQTWWREENGSGQWQPAPHPGGDYDTVLASIREPKNPCAGCQRRGTERVGAREAELWESVAPGSSEVVERIWLDPELRFAVRREQLEGGKVRRRSELQNLRVLPLPPALFATTPPAKQ